MLDMPSNSLQTVLKNSTKSARLRHVHIQARLVKNYLYHYSISSYWINGEKEASPSPELNGPLRQLEFESQLNTT
ncbi:hypothetical protein TWF225_010491 [Orbilia oligospora]|uniref:Uncharacterized protein n=1 Tax=Orbilia oligospora TaxID=2813651 RepID=A0A8H2HRI6_ORBOL|nr:hypothetical protein TWF225_010491 [Orbilia oligospora]TGJ69316.1 hypothetical protein EYR41_005367 [Orbilia oligospora]